MGSKNSAYRSAKYSPPYMSAAYRVFVNYFGSGFAPSICRGRGLHTLTSALTLRSYSLSATNTICKTIASHLQGGDVVQLVGKVGAGKSAVARAIIRAILPNDDEVVPSPTFSLALSYPCMIFSCISLFCLAILFSISFACSAPSFSVIHHLDAYRCFAGMSLLIFVNFSFQIELKQLNFTRAAQNDRRQRLRIHHRMGPGITSSPRPTLHSN